MRSWPFAPANTTAKSVSSTSLSPRFSKKSLDAMAFDVAKKETISSSVRGIVVHSKDFAFRNDFASHDLCTNIGSIFCSVNFGKFKLCNSI